MNLTRKRLEAIRIALDILLIGCGGDDGLIKLSKSVTVTDAKEAREWAAERIKKLDSGTWY